MDLSPIYSYKYFLQIIITYRWNECLFIGISPKNCTTIIYRLFLIYKFTNRVLSDHVTKQCNIIQSTVVKLHKATNVLSVLYVEGKRDTYNMRQRYHIRGGLSRQRINIYSFQRKHVNYGVFVINIHKLLIFMVNILNFR